MQYIFNGVTSDTPESAGVNMRFHAYIIEY